MQLCTPESRAIMDDPCLGRNAVPTAALRKGVQLSLPRKARLLCRSTCCGKIKLQPTPPHANTSTLNFRVQLGCKLRMLA